MGNRWSSLALLLAACSPEVADDVTASARALHTTLDVDAQCVTYTLRDTSSTHAIIAKTPLPR